MTLCVYAITGLAPLEPSLRGMEREPLRLVTAGPVAAIVGQLQRRPRPARLALERYHGTVGRLHVRRGALLPARFGSCFGSLEEVRAVLRSRGSSLRAALARVRGRAQMTVRVVLPPAAPTRRGRAPGHVARAVRGRATTGAGARYLRARAARASEVPGFDAVRPAVARWVREERVETRAGVASVYHLIPRGSAARYRTAVDRAAEAAGVRVVVTGPWPPYALGVW